MIDKAQNKFTELRNRWRRYRHRRFVIRDKKRRMKERDRRTRAGRPPVDNVLVVSNAKHDTNS